MALFKRVQFARCLSTKVAREVSGVAISSRESKEEYNVSPEEKNFYSQNGYFMIKQLFDARTLDNLRQRFIDICNKKVESKGMSVIMEKYLVDVQKKQKPEDCINKIQDILHDEVFMSYSEDPRLLHIVSQFIGEEITALNSMLINKPPGTTRHPPHQDLFYFPVRPVKIIATWTAIDNSTFDNGCLYCVPGTHKLELLPHANYQDSKKFFHLLQNEDKYAPDHKRLHLEMNPGDTVFFHPCLIHGSRANLSKNYRKAMTVHYMSNECQYIDLTGTVQEPLIKEFEEKWQKNGFPESYQHLWKLKTKLIKG